MRIGIKIVCYVALIAGACFFGYNGYDSYTRLMNNSPEESSELPIEEPVAETTGDAIATEGYSQVMGYGAAFFVNIVILAFLLSHDVTNHLGNRVLVGLYNDDGEGVANPEYELAEEEWANGNHLDAIRLMREFLQKNPREQHVALRIAEIYEKDLSNNLAAALEYEEVLKQKLEAERWGWAAIHLCNLYFRLDQPHKAVDLLRRIDSEYGQTAAAGKARKRLAMYESESDSEPIEESTPADETQTS